MRAGFVNSKRNWLPPSRDLDCWRARRLLRSVRVPFAGSGGTPRAGRATRSRSWLGFPGIGCEAAAQGVLGHAHRVGELLEVILAARLAADAAQLEAAEGLARDEGAGDLAVEVEVAGTEGLAGAQKMRGATRIHAARQRIGSCVGERKGLLEIGGAQQREHRPEDLLLRQCIVWRHVGEDGRRDVATLIRQRL